LPLFPIIPSAAPRKVIANLETRVTKADICRLFARRNDLRVGESKANRSEESATDRALTLDLLGVAEKVPRVRRMGSQLADVGRCFRHGRCF
jgi:hypothetical protein